MKARTTWFYRRRSRRDEAGIGSINEQVYNTWAQARGWIEREIPARSGAGDLVLDRVELDAIDDTGESRRIALYEHGPRKWTWIGENEMSVIHRLDDANIERAWKRAETGEIEKLASDLVEKAQEAQSIEADLSHLLYLAFKCGFKTAIG